MTREYLNVLLADSNEGNLVLIKNILQDLKIEINARDFYNGKDLMEYLNSRETIVPEIIFMSYDLPGKNSLECLDAIKADLRFSNIILLVYSEFLPEELIEEIFIRGANIYMRKPDNYQELKKVISEAITVSWQYHTSGLNKDYFIMKVK